MIVEGWLFGLKFHNKFNLDCNTCKGNVKPSNLSPVHLCGHVKYNASVKL